METLDDTLSKRDSFRYVWALLNPQGKYRNRQIWERCIKYWNSLSLQRQRQIYYTLRKQLRRGEELDANPIFCIKDCVPLPENWNGRAGVNDMLKKCKMVSARWPDGGKYGVYTLQEARLFEMKDIKPLN